MCRVCLCVSLSLSVFLSVSVCSCLSIAPSISVFLRLYVCLCVCLSTCLYTYLGVSVSVRYPVCLSLSLSRVDTETRECVSVGGGVTWGCGGGRGRWGGWGQTFQPDRSVNLTDSGEVAKIKRLTPKLRCSVHYSPLLRRVTTCWSHVAPLHILSTHTPLPKDMY